MVRSPTVFEDLVKTICTTNCTWSATVRMVTALVGELGLAASDAPADVPFAGGGRCGGRFVLRRRGQDGLPRCVPADDRLRRELWSARPRGVQRPWTARPRRHRAAARAAGRRAVRVRPHDDAARPLPAADPRLVDAPDLSALDRPAARVTDVGIEQAFRRYREFAGLAFWLTLARDWAPGIELADARRVARQRQATCVCPRPRTRVPLRFAPFGSRRRHAGASGRLNRDATRR